MDCCFDYVWASIKNIIWTKLGACLAVAVPKVATYLPIIIAII